MRLPILSALAAVTLAACAPPPPAPSATPHAVVYSKDARFENARDDLKAAIENRGLVIDNTSHIHKMLERTGKDIGATTTVYKDAEAFSFCSAVISRKTMEADANNIVFCPYTVTVYATAQEPGKVRVAYRVPQPVGSDASKASLKEVENLLDGIAREALGIAKR